MRRPVVLVLSVRDYLHRPLIDLVRLRHGADTQIISMRAWRELDRWFLLRLLFFELPFRIGRIYTPSDLGGRLVRVIVDLAALLGIEVYVAPAHNHPYHRDQPIPLSRRYVDLHALQVVGGFARSSRIVINDPSMRAFFRELGYADRRLVDVPDWIARLFRRPLPTRYRFVFFTEVMQDIDPHTCDRNLQRIVHLLECGALPSLVVKFHPREPQEKIQEYRRAFAPWPQVSFIDLEAPSFDVINESDVIFASFSTALLEALWLGKQIVILDNPLYLNTMMRFYLDNPQRYHVYDVDDMALARFLEAPPTADRRLA